MRRVILGGTFDPIHWGHLRPALHTCQLLEAEQLLLMPSAQPPHRDYPGASAEQRLQMAHLAATEVSQELAQSQSPLTCLAEAWELNQDRKSYTELTLSQLKQRWPDDTLIFLLGEDAFAGLPSWYNWQQLVAHAHLVVMQRPHSRLQLSVQLQAWLAQVETDSREPLLAASQGLVWRAETPTYAVSATAIRQAIQHQQPWRHDVPNLVADYIEQHHLYR